MRKFGIAIIIVLIIWVLWFANKVITTLKSMTYNFNSFKGLKLDFDFISGSSQNSDRPIKLTGTINLTFGNVLNSICISTIKIDIFYKNIYLGYYSKPSKTNLQAGVDNIIPFMLFLMFNPETQQIIFDYAVDKLDAKDFRYESKMIVYGIPIPSTGTFV